MLGYGHKELMDRVVSHPNWVKVKNKWHLDHVFPIKAFLDYDIKDVKLVNCLENLRPIKADENCSKQDYYNAEDFEFWLKLKGIENESPSLRF